MQSCILCGFAAWSYFSSSSSCHVFPLQCNMSALLLSVSGSVVYVSLHVATVTANTATPTTTTTTTPSFLSLIHPHSIQLATCLSPSDFPLHTALHHRTESSAIWLFSARKIQLNNGSANKYIQCSISTTGLCILPFYLLFVISLQTCHVLNKQCCNSHYGYSEGMQ
jgi:hypothetical protein